VPSWLAAAGVLVFDEAHHVTADSYLQILRWREGAGRERPFARIGLSATPFRVDVERSNRLARLFDRSLVTGTLGELEWKERIRWFQDEGYLAHVHHNDMRLGIVEPTSEEESLLSENPNLETGLDSVNRRLGEDDARNRRFVDLVLSMPRDWQVIMFAASVRHAKRLAVLLSHRGVPARPVWKELAPWARRDAIEAFRQGTVRILTNYNVLAEGFDAPKINAIVIARLVASDVFFLQMLGRGMRGPKNQGTEDCTLWTTGERLPRRFDPQGNVDVERYEYLWNGT
jgi:superfamily II DNA or RNA helicase